MKVNIDKDDNESSKSEAVTLSGYNHPNVVRYVEDFLYKDVHAIIMEYCDSKCTRL